MSSTFTTGESTPYGRFLAGSMLGGTGGGEGDGLEVAGSHAVSENCQMVTSKRFAARQPSAEWPVRRAPSLSRPAADTTRPAG
jgi:hypothetical protein